MAQQGYYDSSGNWVDPPDRNPDGSIKTDGGSNGDNNSSGGNSPDWGAYEKQLREGAAARGVTYDDSDLMGIKHRDGSQASIDQALKSSLERYDERASNKTGGSDKPTSSAGGGSAFQEWTHQGGMGGQSGGSDAYASLLQQMQATTAAKDAENKARNDALYATLLARSKQGLAIDRNDPIIRAQADAYSANQTRAQRDYLNQVAEKAGPLANIGGEERLSAERLGQATGSFEAELMGRELTARRDEIQNALTGMAGMLTADQVQELQRELALLDNAIKQQSLGLQGRGLDIQQQGLDSENDRWAQEFGRNITNDAQMWDLRRLGYPV